MALEEKISQHFNCPFVYSPEHELYVCKNGVHFTEEEYKQHKNDPEWLEDEYKIRSTDPDYLLIAYGQFKDTELIWYTTKEEIMSTNKTKNNPIADKQSEETNLDDIKNYGTYNISNKNQEPKQKANKTVTLICFALGLVSIVSMYISTVHTATYLFDYVDILSAWLMSAVITIYSSTAFEVVILFHERKRHILSVIFAMLWALVITFSMVTTVSVFYDRFNFTTLENAEEHKAEDSARVELKIIDEDIQLLVKNTAELSETIKEMRKEGYVTRAQEASDKELKPLESELASLRERRREILRESPNASKNADEVHRKETLFAFLGRIMGIEGGILEFIMSTLSAIFVNLISPLSLTVVVSLKGGKE